MLEIVIEQDSFCLQRVQVFHAVSMDVINTVTELFRGTCTIVPDPVQRSLGRISEERASKKTPKNVIGVSQIGKY